MKPDVARVRRARRAEYDMGSGVALQQDSRADRLVVRVSYQYENLLLTTEHSLTRN